MFSKSISFGCMFICLCLLLLSTLKRIDGKPHGDLIIIGHGSDHGHHHSHPQMIPIPIPIPMGGHNYHSTKIIPIHIPSHGKPFHQHITIKGPKGYANSYSHHTNHHHEEHEDYEHGPNEYAHAGHGKMYKDDVQMDNDDYGRYDGYWNHIRHSAAGFGLN